MEREWRWINRGGFVGVSLWWYVEEGLIEGYFFVRDSSTGVSSWGYVEVYEGDSSCRIFGGDL